MNRISPFTDPNLLYGFSAGDDTGVYKLSDDLAIAQSVDFFTPIVDDPYRFGKISAANSLSDLYTIGARPVTALNILAVPCSLGMDVVGEILRGGADVVKEAGAVLLGGHSVEDDEPKYGLAVTGIVHPDKMIANTDAKPGDVIVLTKKIGTGILSNVAKMKGSLAGALKTLGSAIPAEVYEEAERSMMRLNKKASEVMEEFDVHACTDVTGYGLLGHALNIAEASSVKISINYFNVPKFDGIESFAISGTKGGGEKNYDWVKNRLSIGAGVTHENVMVLCDAQTSGGLLMAAPLDSSETLVKRLRENGDETASVIGNVEEGDAGTLAVY